MSAHTAGGATVTTPCKSASPITAELHHATAMCGLPPHSQNAIVKCSNAIAAHAYERVSFSLPGIASTHGSTASGSVTTDRTIVRKTPKPRELSLPTLSLSHASEPEIAYALPTAHTSGSSVYIAAAGISALSAVTRSASDAEANIKECSSSEVQRRPRWAAAAMQTTTSISKKNCGIPSESESGKASTNGMHTVLSKS